MGANGNNYFDMGFMQRVTLCPYIHREKAIEVYITITNAEQVYSHWGCHKPPWPELNSMVMEN